MDGPSRFDIALRLTRRSGRDDYGLHDHVNRILLLPRRERDQSLCFITLRIESLCTLRLLGLQLEVRGGAENWSWWRGVAGDGENRKLSGVLESDSSSTCFLVVFFLLYVGPAFRPSGRDVI